MTLEESVIKHKCERDHLFFTRVFFKHRQNIKFRVNWHHKLIADVVEDVIQGRRKNVVINVSPGSSKTEIVVINFIARGLALNPRARFLHLSYSDDLALLNSQTARDIISSDEYQALWPLKISDDTKSKKRWNVEVDGKNAGGVYATSLNGQITGFRAGHMSNGWQGCIVIDDPCKPEDAFSKAKMTAANRRLLTTVKSRKANPETPIVVIMQRISDADPSQFIRDGNLGPDWSHVIIPAVIDETYVNELEAKYRDEIQRDAEGRFSYWPYKERIEELLAMEKGQAGSDGAATSRHVFAAQFQQNPVSLGGNIIKSEHFKYYSVLPVIKYRKIFCDTAMKTKEANDNSVLSCFGLGEDNKLYFIDTLVGKFEAPELERRVIAFWNKHLNKDIYPADKFGQLRQLVIEEAASGVGLLQKLKLLGQIPIKGIIRVKDKLTRVLDVLAYIESGLVYLPSDASFISDFITECAAFTADMSHRRDDQVDVLTDAIVDLLTSLNKLEQWKNLI